MLMRRIGEFYSRDHDCVGCFSDECLWIELDENGSRPSSPPCGLVYLASGASSNLMHVLADASTSVAETFKASGLAATDVATRDAGVHVSSCDPYQESYLKELTSTSHRASQICQSFPIPSVFMPRLTPLDSRFHSLPQIPSERLGRPARLYITRLQLYLCKDPRRDRSHKGGCTRDGVDRVGSAVYLDLFEYKSWVGRGDHC